MSSSPAAGSGSSKSYLAAKSKHSHTSGSSSSRSRNIATEQDRQARNKDPRTGRTYGDDDDGGHMVKKPAR
jgi:hypothetical protein